MNRTQLHAARVEAYFLALWDGRPGTRPTSVALEAKWRREYHEQAERIVSEYERQGLFDIREVA